MVVTDRRFTRVNKLTKASEFSQVFGTGKRSVGPSLMVIARPNGLARARLGLAIAKKVVKRAVDRNRIKRIVRDDFRHHLHVLHGLDVVVMARSGLDRTAVKDLRNRLQRHWQRLQVIDELQQPRS